jgi:ABC-2 type transport system permease protein
LLSTFLTPLLFIGVIATIVVITVKNSDKEVVAVVDGSGIFKSATDSNKSVKFVVDPTVDTSNFSSKGYSAILYSPKTGINAGDNWKIYSKKNFGVISSDQVDQKLSQQVEKDLFLRYGVDAAQVDSIRSLARAITAEPAILEQGESEKRGEFRRCLRRWICRGIPYLHHLIYLWCDGYARSNGGKNQPHC